VFIVAIAASRILTAGSVAIAVIILGRILQPLILRMPLPWILNHATWYVRESHLKRLRRQEWLI